MLLLQFDYLHHLLFGYQALESVGSRNLPQTLENCSTSVFVEEVRGILEVEYYQEQENESWKSAEESIDFSPIPQPVVAQRYEYSSHSERTLQNQRILLSQVVVNSLAQNGDSDAHIGFAACPCHQNPYSCRHHTPAQTDQHETGNRTRPSEYHTEAPPEIIRIVHEHQVAHENSQKQCHLVTRNTGLVLTVVAAQLCDQRVYYFGALVVGPLGLG